MRPRPLAGNVFLFAQASRLVRQPFGGSGGRALRGSAQAEPDWPLAKCKESPFPKKIVSQIGWLHSGGYMINLDDQHWKTFQGAYRRPYDASNRLRELEFGPKDIKAIWKEFWNELHHQGNVDTASYAVVPQLARICIARGLLDWNVFGLVATIEECRTSPQNPPIPSWLESDYHSAIMQLAEFGARHFSETWPKELTLSFLVIASYAKGLRKQGKILITFTEDDELDAILGGSSD